MPQERAPGDVVKFRVAGPGFAPGAGGVCQPARFARAAPAGPNPIFNPEGRGWWGLGNKKGDLIAQAAVRASLLKAGLCHLLRRRSPISPSGE